MQEKNFEYTEKESGIFGDVLRPLIEVEIKGETPEWIKKLIVYIHQLKFRLNGKEFELPVAISDSNDVPPIFGRVKGLDRFDANFLRGQKIKLAWEEQNRITSSILKQKGWKIYLIPHKCGNLNTR